MPTGSAARTPGAAVLVPARPAASPQVPARPKAGPRRPTGGRVRRWWRAHRGDLLAHAGLLALAGYVTVLVWAHLGRQVFALNPNDQYFAEWMFLDQAHAVAHLANPFFSQAQNAPGGVNLMANVAMQLVGWVLAPLTLTAGPASTVAVTVTMNLAATGSAWYHLLSRHLVRHRGAAWLGAAFCAFGPGMISQSSGHLHVAAQYLVPFILLALARLAGLVAPARLRPVARSRLRRWLRLRPWLCVGAGLGLLVAAQLLIAEEVLFIAAVAAAVAGAGYALARPDATRAAAGTLLRGLIVAAVVVLVIDGYPLWMQFFGPQHYIGLPTTYSADLASFVSFPTQSLGGLLGGVRYAPNPAEQVTFFGWPLLVGAAGLAALLWRALAARIIAVTGAVAAMLSLGPTVIWRNHSTGIPGPYRLVGWLPVAGDLIVLRLGLITAVAIGLLVALGAQAVLDLPAGRRGGVSMRRIGVVVGAAMLLPLVPLPLPTRPAAVVPAFITSGDWKRYVRPGRTLVPVDPGWAGYIEWAVAGRADFRVPQGYALVPADPPGDLRGQWNETPCPTVDLLTRIGGGQSPPVGPAQHTQAATDLHRLGADAVVMQVSAVHTAQVAAQVSRLLGMAPQRVDDVFVWPVPPA